ncbi:MAG TPA: LamG domain-containing protein [Polyangiaceae bacterium]|nr:LamG domain-containing protein [Polyangiaceae bacterium]
MAGALACTPLASEDDLFDDGPASSGGNGAGGNASGGSASEGSAAGGSASNGSAAGGNASGAAAAASGMPPHPDATSGLPSGGAAGANAAVDASVPATTGGAAGAGASPSPVDAGPPPAPPVPACIGSAASLDGASAIEITNAVQDDFTLEAWILARASRAGTQAFQGRGVIDGDFIGAGDDFATSVLNDHFAFGVGNPDITLQGTSSVVGEEWVHVAATRRAATGEMAVIVNGVLESSGTGVNRNSLTDVPTLAIGGASQARQFIGLLDEVRIWNIVRSPDEIRASMRQIVSADEPGLVGYYRFEDRGSVTTRDSSLQGSDGVLLGAPGYEPSPVLCPMASSAP